MPTYGSLDSLVEKVRVVPARLPLKRTVGVEIETNAPDGHQAASAVRNAGFAPIDKGPICMRHCQDPECLTYLVHPQRDGSVTGPEVVIGGPHGTPVYEPILIDTIEQVCTVLLNNRASTNTATGGHVHVATGDVDFDAVTRLVMNMEILQRDIRILMSAGLRDVRKTGNADNVPSVQLFERSGRFNRTSWNAGSKNASIIGGNAWVMFKDNQYKENADPTAEFRGWNGTLDAWRLVYHLYVSAALVESAVEGRNAEPDQSLVDFLADWLPPYVQGLMCRQYAVRAGQDLGAADIDNQDFIQVMTRQRRDMAKDPFRPAERETMCPLCGNYLGWNREDGLKGQTCGCGHEFTGRERNPKARVMADVG